MFTIPPLTSDVIVMSLDSLASPSMNINVAAMQGSDHNRGWGFGWYPGDHQSAMLTKDPTANSSLVLMDTVFDWSNFRSTVFFAKIKAATDGYTHTETQPFSRSYAGRDWMFAHNGHLDKLALDALHGDHIRLLEPIGGTDSELAFCNLLTLIQKGDARRICEIEAELLHSWFKRFDLLGSSDMFLTDGDSVVCFAGSQSPKKIHYSRIQPPNNQDILSCEAADIRLSDPRDTYRSAMIISTSPFSTGDWIQLQPGQMIIVRRSAVVWDSLPFFQKQISGSCVPEAKQKVSFSSNSETNGKKEHVLNARSVTHTSEGEALGYRLYEVTHKTDYSYTIPVEHSTHTFRLQPTDDPMQEVVSSKLTLTSSAEEIQYEDVFGNQALHCIIDKPYTMLSVAATSRVKIYAAPPDDHSFSQRQTTIPLIWMPWQRQMMNPYLLPPELPESQLEELTHYAMSFVERNDYHLLKTVQDINMRIYRDYRYVTGSTLINTTPFEVYSTREGVCQDFANLFICLTRLLSIPARYRMGYIYTGANYENKIQSDASHAWAEVYLPYVGWRGFDPTNGCNVAQDHIRVACGRNFIDATPTSGTIYRGGGAETLQASVVMKEILEG